MYFSRSVVPYSGHIEKDNSTALWNRHIGLFAYRAGLLRQYKNFPVCDLEKAEKFEHLRIIWNGLRINVATAANPASQTHPTNRPVAVSIAPMIRIVSHSRLP